MEEVFKDIEGYEGLYQVSNLGRVKSTNKIIHGRGIKKVVDEYFIKPTKNPNGYYKVCLYSENKMKQISLHRLVAITFTDSPNLKLQVNHLDGNKSNNIITNLSWCTGSENIKHGVDNGLFRTGETHPMSKLTADQVRLIKYTYQNHPRKEVANMFGIHLTTLWGILTGKLWKHI